MAQDGGPIFRSSIDVVIVPTTVMDKDGGYVSGIRPPEFRLYDNDKLQNIKVDETYTPLSLVVVIQADAKVEAVIPKIKKVGTLLHNTVAGESGEIAIVSFDHRIQTLTDFTSDPEKIEQGLKKLAPGSSQAVLNDAVTEAARMLSRRPKERRRVILLISGSRDQGSGGRLREALQAVEFGNITVYTLNVSRLYSEFTANPALPRPDPIPAAARPPMPGGGAQTPTTVAQMTGSPGYGADFMPLLVELYRGAKGVFFDNPVEVFTKYTGGKEFPFVDQKELERAVQEVGREIHNQYLLTYTPNNQMEGGLHRIRVEVLRPDLEVRTRGGYWLAARP